MAPLPLLPRRRSVEFTKSTSESDRSDEDRSEEDADDDEEEEGEDGESGFRSLDMWRSVFLAGKGCIEVDVGDDGALAVGSEEGPDVKWASCCASEAASTDWRAARGLFGLRLLMRRRRF